MRHRRWPWGLAAGVAAADLLSKQWASLALPRAVPGGSGFQLALVRNPGIALGLGASHPVIAGTAAMITTAIVAWWLTRSNGPLLRAGLALALGGGVGNVADRVRHGAVTDWIHLPGYPAIFNLADVAIRLGAVMVLAGLWLGRGAHPAGASSSEGPSPALVRVFTEQPRLGRRRGRTG